ncbi:MAG: type II toxin-antitoxin system VapC family toxin [Actinobacteria bacterium]|nr:type II toxin-antitoxin system VapC family toxin [Actinomycetota bacterium]
MTRLVLDAAAAVEIFLGTTEGNRLAGQMPAGSTTYVPEHFYVEVAAALRRMELVGAVPVARVGVAYRRLRRLKATRAEVRPLLPPAWRLRHNLTIADALYVALARKLGATLVTGDQRLTRAPNLQIPVIN